MDRQPRVCAKPLTTFYLGDQQFLAQHTGIPRLYQIDSSTLQAISICRRGATVPDHGAAIVEASAGRLPATMAEDLLRQDLFIDCTRLVDADRPASRVTTGITTVAIPTADRPSMLRRALVSLMAHCRLHGAAPRILIVDGSTGAAEQAATLHAAAEARDVWVSRVDYVGQREAAALREGLHQLAGIEPDLLAFALTPGATGSNRNLILALTRGEQVLMVDDDVLWETWSGETDDAITLSGHEESFRTRYFRSRADALASVTFANIDLLANHERLLGRAVTDAIAADATDVELLSPCASACAALADPARGAIVLTFAGIAGDGALHCPYRALFAPAGSGHVGDLSEADYDMAMHSREQTRIVTRYTVTHAPQCMAYCVGVSNDRVLPPFTPRGRNQDGLFGGMIGLSDEEAFYGHVPCGVVHDSLRTAEYGTAVRSLDETRVADVLLTLLSSYRVSRVPSGPARLTWLGSNLERLSELPAQRFRAEVLEALVERHGSELSTAERLIAGGGGSPAFIQDVDNYRQQFLAAVRRSDFGLPVECEDLAAFQGFVGQFGALVRVWPTVLAAAAQLNSTSLAARPTLDREVHT